MGKVKELEALGYNFGCCITEPVLTLGRRLEAAGQLMSAKNNNKKTWFIRFKSLVHVYVRNSHAGKNQSWLIHRVDQLSLENASKFSQVLLGFG